MTTSENTALLIVRELRCRRFALALSAIVALIALTILAGWVFDIESLKGFVLGPVVMIPLTAISFLCAAAAIAIQTLDSDNSALRRCGSALSALVLALGSLMLAQRIVGFELPINTLLFGEALRRYPYRPLGMMAANSALNFTCIGLSLCFPSVHVRDRRVANGFALAVICVASIALVGYAYGVRALYSFDQYAAMALSTAVCSLALGMALIAAKPKCGLAATLIAEDAGGMFTRKLLPIALIVPFVLGLGWLQARRLELLGRETAVALVVVLIAAIYTAVLLHSARAVSALDRDCRDALANAEEAQARAEDASRRKAEFLTMMSHELRTPLNAISGYTQLIELGLRGPVTEEQRVDLARIRRSEEHLLGIIRDILDFGSVERGQYKFEIAPVALSPVLHTSVSAVTALASAKGVSIVEEAWQMTDPRDKRGNRELEVLADAKKLRQAMINLLTYSIRLADHESQVLVAVRAIDTGILVSVSESGRGIPAEWLDTIFEPFTQIEPTLTRTTEGIGLGLALCRQLLRGMGSDVHVESTPGVGSRFSIVLRSAASDSALDSEDAVASQISMGVA